MKKALMIAIGLLWSLASGTVSMRLEVSEAATISGLCLTEPEFTDFNAMTERQIREFLADPEKAGGFLKNPFQDVPETGGELVDAASEILQAAQNTKINPRVLLTTLQKESGAIRSIERLEDDGLRLLGGCGTPTSAKKQIHCMAEQLRRDFDRLSQCNPTLGGWQVDVVKFAGNTRTPPQATDEPETDASGELIAVQPQSKAVTTLYQYTPWAGLLLGGGHRSFDPKKPRRPLVGGNGSFCRLWNQFGFERLPGPLALSPQTVTLTCSPDTRRCVSINASGGDISGGSYTWTNSNGVITITEVNEQNIQLKPPTNDGSKINGPAYAIQANNTTDGFSCNLFHFVKEVYGCNDQVVISCTFFDASVCDNTGIISFARGANNNMCPFPAFADECTGLRTIRQFQCDIREQNGIPKTCNPCGISMQGGATITVSGSSGPPVEMTVTVR